MHFNMRLEEMGSKLGRLALFLDPYHRGLVLTDADTMLEVRVTAGKFWAARGYSQGEVLALSTEMRAYEAYMAPYNQGLGKPGFDGVMTYWKALVGASPQLASLALLVFSMRPQAAGAERDFSVFGSIHSDALSRLHSANAHTVAIIKRAIQADGPPAEGRHQKKARLTVDQHEAAQGGASGSEAEPSADADPGDDDDSIDLTEAELAAGARAGLLVKRACQACMGLLACIVPTRSPTHTLLLRCRLHERPARQGVQTGCGSRRDGHQRSRGACVCRAKDAPRRGRSARGALCRASQVPPAGPAEPRRRWL